MVVRRRVDGDARAVLLGGQERPHSRVVSCYVDLQAPGGPHRASVTDPVGRRCWLLSVKLWFWPYVESPPGRNNFRLFTGTTPIGAADEMLGWEEVLPLRNVAGQPIDWGVSDDQLSMEWSMNTLYRGQARRFGIWGWRTGDWSTSIWASFEVSEE